MKYESIIGLEVHVELNTNTKLLCGCKNEFGAPPNTLTCPICTGQPAALPKLNKQAVHYAIKAGLALGCNIAEETKFDRKNYFYPDLPKGYQVTQYDMPICIDGYIDIGHKKIRIERIHIEEDAGKLIHEQDTTLVDFNRSGVPLIEIVSKPDIRSSEEAVMYLKKLRTTLLYTGVSDCKMNEGSFRVDVNVSVRPKDSPTFGVRTELKNINSFQYAQDAIEYEINRHIELYEKGDSPITETRRYDEKSKKTYSMRAKEDTTMYMYLPDTELVPLKITKEEVDAIKETIPMLPDERERMYIEKYGLTPFDCENLLQDIHVANYFEEAALQAKNPKNCANLLITELFSLAGNERDLKIAPKTLAVVSDLMSDEVINSSTTKSLLKLLWEKEFDVHQYIKEKDLMQINDKDVLKGYIDTVMEENPKVVEDYRNGKTRALKALTGMVMAKTKGRANPKLLQTLFNEKLS